MVGFKQASLLGGCLFLKDAKKKLCFQVSNDMGGVCVRVCVCVLGSPMGLKQTECASFKNLNVPRVL